MFTNYLLSAAILFAEVFSFVRGEFKFCLIISGIFLLYSGIRLLMSNDFQEHSNDISGMADGSADQITETA